MKKLKFILLIFLIVIVQGLQLIFNCGLSVFDCSKIYAQEREPLFYLGAYAAYNLNTHTANFKELPPVPNCCKGFTSGIGSGFALGGLFDYDINSVFSLGLRLGYSSLGAKLLVHDKNIGNTTVIQNGVTTVTPVSVDHSIDSKINVVGIEPVLSIKIIDNLKGIVGLDLSYLLTGQFSQMEQIISPNNVTFLDGRIIQNDYYNLDIPGKPSLLFFGMLGLGYDLPMGKDMYITPEIKYFLPFNNVANVDWKPAHWQFGASVRFPIYPKIEKPLELKPIIRIDTAIPLPMPKISSNIEAVGVSRDGKIQKTPTIVIEEMETEEGFPLLPHVFFPEGSADLKLSGLKLLTKEETNSFVEDSLKWNTLEIYSDLLNIVGYRMHKFPNAKLTITGCNKNLDAEAKNLNLSKQRAEAVKDYLVKIWGIKPNRITIKQQNLPDNPGNNTVVDGQIENQRVELSSSNSDLLKPVFLKEIDRTANPPVVEITPTVKSEAGLSSWDVNIEQSGNSLRSYSGKILPEKIKWEVEKEPIPKLETPVNIKLTAHDSINQPSKSETNLSIQQLTIKKKRYEMKGDKKIERFSLIVFDYDKADIKPHHKVILQDIKSKIMPNSMVTIEGYADRTGDSAYNKDLALRRSNETEKILQVTPANLTINPVGSDVLLYDNNSPQGRSYCRTVKIKIETPVGK
jgi:outer membrane protein OmpA-like peptidoglycan-associated protein